MMMDEHVDRTPPTVPPADAAPTPAAPRSARPPLLERRRGTVRTNCPRCGYDLRGIIHDWSDRCPLDGRCTECGLAFAWREIFRPHFGRPKWCVEYAARKRWIDACVRTFVRALWPGFWKRFSIVLPIRGRRLAGFVITIAVAVYVAVAVMHSVGYTIQTNALRGVGGPARLGWVVDPAPELAVRAALKPWSNVGAGAGGRQFRGQTPHSFWRASWAGPTRRGRPGASLVWPCVPVVFSVACALGLVSLRTTMARARVRTLHIVRIVVYGLAIPVFIVGLESIAVVLAAGRWGPAPYKLSGPGAILGLIAVMWWWRSALVHYLRVEAPKAVLASCFTIAVLATLAVLHYIGLEFTVNLIVPLMPKS